MKNRDFAKFYDNLSLMDKERKKAWVAKSAAARREAARNSRYRIWLEWKELKGNGLRITDAARVMGVSYYSLKRAIEEFDDGKATP